MRFQVILAAAALAVCANAAAQAPLAPAAGPPSLADILAHSPASDWRPLNPENTLYMELPSGRVIIELSPDFSPEHAANVRALARARYWDGAAITRVQDNYVTQWGRVEGDAHDRGDARTEILIPIRVKLASAMVSGPRAMALRPGCRIATAPSVSVATILRAQATAPNSMSLSAKRRGI
jgi:hypothetical protein